MTCKKQHDGQGSLGPVPCLLAAVIRMVFRPSAGHQLRNVSGKKNEDLAGFAECADCGDRTANAHTHCTRASQYLANPPLLQGVRFQGRFSGGLTSSCGNQYILSGRRSSSSRSDVISVHCCLQPLPRGQRFKVLNSEMSVYLQIISVQNNHR